MIYFQTLFSMIIIVQAMVVKSHTWFPDPQRGASLQARWNRYKAIPCKTEVAVENVCGKLLQPTCSKPIGRPADHETESCDKFCCHAGYLTGFCKGTVTIGVNAVINPSANGATEYTPKIDGYSGCKCTNEVKDAICGPDGSFIGIRCPFDRSACARKCCRQGKTGGRCRGFMRSKCKCD